MCGIVGVFGHINRTRIKMFEEMLAMDAIRGWDSTGIAVIGSAGVNTFKDIVLPAELLSHPDYKQANQHAPLCMIGHNRAATRGVITEKNAHPFTHKHITMVHNGTLDATWRLPKHWKFGTDSEAIAYCIAEHGIEDTWAVLDGAATLVYWDDNEKTLNVISNNKRPFYMQPLKNNDGLVWSSERWTLMTAAMRTGIEFENIAKVYTPTTDLLYSFTWKPNEKVFTFKEKKLAPFKYGNSIAGYCAVAPLKKKKKKKNGKGTTTGAGNVVVPFKSAEASAKVFQEWKQQYQKRHPLDPQDDPYSDERMRQEYPELFETPNSRTDADLDTRAVPFRGRHVANKNNRTAERFHQLFNLVELNAKYSTPEWFLATYVGCCECETPFDYNDSFTARVLNATSAICQLCQRDLWISSGVAPDEIRMQ